MGTIAGMGEEKRRMTGARPMSKKALHYGVCNRWLYLNKSSRIETGVVCAVFVTFRQGKDCREAVQSS